MTYLEKLHRIKAFVFDVDGVFTDGSILLTPEGMHRTMNVLDGYAVQQAMKADYKIGIITGGDDPSVRYRFSYLGVEDYYAKVSDKISVFHSFCEKYALSPEEIACVGDDLPDFSMMQESGVSFCPPNAVQEILDSADFVLAKKGGEGAVRDAIERVMKVQKKWSFSEKTRSV